MVGSTVKQRVKEAFDAAGIGTPPDIHIVQLRPEDPRPTPEETNAPPATGSAHPIGPGSQKEGRA
jgi:hypothetical protein